MKTLRYIALLLWCLAYMVMAAPVTVSWLPVVSNPPVTQYRIYRVASPAPILLTGTSSTSIVLDAQEGWQIVVTAFNDSESQPSAPQTVRLPIASPGSKKVTLQFSSDLKNWTDWQTSEFPAAGNYQFFRIKTETP